jgi:hypothetical protein
VNAAIVVQNPFVSGVTVLAALILAFTIFRSWLRGRWERAENPIYRIEPDIDLRPVPSASYGEASDGVGSGPRSATPRRGGRRRGPLAFIVGVLVGVFVLPAAIRNGAEPAMNAVTAVQARLAEAIGKVDPTLVGAIGGAEDVAGSFVLAMQKELPRQVDDRTTLVSVAGGNGVVTLGHRISEPVPDAESGAFAEAAKERIVSGTCAATPGTEIRTLNDKGIEFRFVYADAAGRTIAAITLEPDFCERSRS